MRKISFMLILTLLLSIISMPTYGQDKIISKIIRQLPDKALDVGSEYEIKYQVQGNAIEYESHKKQEIILILNTSNTMSKYIGVGEGLSKAAKNFVNELKTGVDIKVGVIAYNFKGKTVSDLVKLESVIDKDNLIKKINEALVKRTKTIRGTNLGDALRVAYKLFSDESDVQRHFVILSDGVPNAATIKVDDENTLDDLKYEMNLDKDIIETNIKYHPFVQDSLEESSNAVEFDVNYKDTKFQMGDTYVEVVAKKINQTNKNIKSHIIHFERVSGKFTNEEAMANNRKIGTVLKIPLKDGEIPLHEVKNANDLMSAFESIRKDIGDSIQFPKFEFSETYPAGLIVKEVPEGLIITNNDDGTTTVHGNVPGIQMIKVKGTERKYQVSGNWKIKIGFEKTKEKKTYKLNPGKVEYKDPIGNTGETSIDIEDGKIDLNGDNSGVTTPEGEVTPEPGTIVSIDYISDISFTDQGDNDSTEIIKNGSFIGKLKFTVNDSISSLSNVEVQLAGDGLNSLTIKPISSNVSVNAHKKIIFNNNVSSGEHEILFLLKAESEIGNTNDEIEVNEISYNSSNKEECSEKITISEGNSPDII